MNATEKLQEVIGKGRELAFDLYQIRTSIMENGTDGDHLIDPLQFFHDGLIVAAASLEASLSEGPMEFDDDFDVDNEPIVGKLIEDYLVDTNTHVSHLAEVSGVSRTTIENIIGGNTTPRRATLDKLSKAIGFDLSPTDA